MKKTLEDIDHFRWIRNNPDSFKEQSFELVYSCAMSHARVDSSWVTANGKMATSKFLSSGAYLVYKQPFLVKRVITIFSFSICSQCTVIYILQSLLGMSVSSVRMVQVYKGSFLSIKFSQHAWLHQWATSLLPKSVVCPKFVLNLLHLTKFSRWPSILLLAVMIQVHPPQRFPKLKAPYSNLNSYKVRVTFWTWKIFEDGNQYSDSDIVGNSAAKAEALDSC